MDLLRQTASRHSLGACLAVVVDCAERCERVARSTLDTRETGRKSLPCFCCHSRWPDGSGLDGNAIDGESRFRKSNVCHARSTERHARQSAIMRAACRRVPSSRSSACSAWSPVRSAGTTVRSSGTCVRPSSHPLRSAASAAMAVPPSSPRLPCVSRHRGWQLAAVAVPRGAMAAVWQQWQRHEEASFGMKRCLSRLTIPRACSSLVTR
jgi:hypothetical protein